MLHKVVAQKTQDLVATLWNAPQDSVPQILKNISQKMAIYSTEQAKAFWADLAQKAQKKPALLLEIHGAECEYYFHLHKYNEALTAIETRLQHAKQQEDYTEIGETYLQLGQFYRFMKKSDKALRNLFKALQVFEKHKIQHGLCEVYMELGNFYCFTAPSKAREYAQKGYQLQQYASKKRSIISNLNTIALTYREQDSLVKALVWYEKALQEATAHKDEEWIGLVSGNMSIVYLQQKDYDKAMLYIQKDLQASQDIGNTTNTLLGVADIYMAKNQLDSAKPYIDSAMTLAKRTKRAELLFGVHRRYKQYYSKTKEFERALYHTEETLRYKDSLDRQVQLEEIGHVQAQYDFDRQEEQITFLKDKTTLQQQNIQQQYLLSYVGSTATAILVCFMYFLYRKNRETRKLNQTLNIQKEEILTQNEELQQNQEEILASRNFIEKQNEHLETQNIQIRDGIRAALTIQTAILPTEAHLNQLLGKYFVWYQPKDIVSGDFYWIDRVGNQTFVIVADCTGHGVAGAFMSLIASNLLEKIIFQQDIVNPADILTELHILVKKALHQSENDDTTGLDIAIVALEKQANGTQVVFSGAKRPLYYINASAPQKVHTLLGSRKSIGGFQNEKIHF
ncbi:MAG: hypothetical protein EAZ95_18970, partial [Bacteroidetes bacterium]